MSVIWWQRRRIDWNACDLKNNSIQTKMMFFATRPKTPHTKAFDERIFKMELKIVVFGGGV